MFQVKTYLEQYKVYQEIIKLYSWQPKTIKIQYLGVVHKQLHPREDGRGGRKKMLQGDFQGTEGKG